MSPTPAVYVTQHTQQHTDRTRLRVEAVDDGPIVRVHLRALTTLGELDVAMTADAAAQLADALVEAATTAETYWLPERVEYIDGGAA